MAVTTASIFCCFVLYMAVTTAPRTSNPSCGCAASVIISGPWHGADKGIAERLPSPKHHQLVHLHEQLVQDEMVNCWVPERKHIASKQAMTNNKKM